MLLTGCIREGGDRCAFENNLLLSFRYEDSEGGNHFSEKISRISVFVFNEQGYFVVGKDVEQVALSVWSGAGLNLLPGTYRIVCWGNVLKNTSFGKLTPGSLLKDAYL